MNILLRYPKIVAAYSPHFEDLFSREGYVHFCRYLSGLLVSENKTVEGINRLFVLDRRNQSSCNRFLGCQNFDIDALHARRLGLLQSKEATHFKTGNQGVLSLDDTLLSHYGRQMEKIHNLYDHVNGCYILAHNLVSLHYSDDATDYPIAHTLWEPADWEAIGLKMKALGVHVNANKFANRFTNPTKWRHYMRDRYRDCKDKHPDLRAMYKTKLDIGLGLVRQFRVNYPAIDLPVAMDSGYTSADLCQIL